MNLPLSITFGLIPMAIAIIATSIAWRFIRHRILFFILAVVTSFGLKHFTLVATGIIEGIYWRMGKASSMAFLGIDQLRYDLTVYAQIFIVPIILWRLFIVMRK